MMPRRVRLWLPASVALLVAACWLGGFAWFVHVIHHPAEPPPHAGGIVALTGGAGRVDRALHLLADGQAGQLLLSGIGGGSDLATIGRLAGIDTQPLADRITVGRYAASTRGNGVETAAWADQNHIRSLIVVTAAWHMPRALAELHRALPGVRLYASPVFPDPAGKGPGWKLEAGEYAKYLLTVSGLSVWFPPREPVSPYVLPVGTSG